MPLLLPILLCLAGIVISLLPSDDIAPAPATRGNWVAMAIAAAAVIVLVGFVVSRLDGHDAPEMAKASDTPSAVHPSGHSAL